MTDPDDRYFEKTVWEEFTFVHDFTKQIPPGSTNVSSISVVPLDSAGSAAPSIYISSAVVPSSAKVNVKVTGGSANNMYTLRLRAITDNAEKIEAIITMKVLP